MTFQDLMVEPGGVGPDAGESAFSRIRWAGLAGREHGNGTAGPAFVLLHGLTFDRGMWSPVLDALPEGLRAIAFDLPGHGASPGLPEQGLAPVVEAIHEAVLEAGLDAPVLVGHSVGGPLASIYAATHGAAAVVSIEAPIRVEPFAAPIRGLAGSDFSAAWEPFRASMRMDLLPAAERELLQSGERISRELVLAYQSDLLDRPLAEVVAWRDQGLSRLGEAGTPYVSLHSNPVDPAERAWLLERLPQAEILVWPVRHHFPHLAEPARFAALLARVAEGL